MSKKLITILATCLLAGSALAIPMKGMIVGGVEAGPNEFPFIVSLQTNLYGLGHFCGGTLIKQNWVLTAAHCIDPQAPLDRIYVGMTSQSQKGQAEVFTPVKQIRHPSYSEDTQDWDYALIELSGDSKFKPAELNTAVLNIPAQSSSNEIMATVAGWGVTSENAYNIPDQLLKVDVPLVDAAECKKAYSNATDRMICAGYAQGGKDSCQGDSGGPLMIKNSNGDYILAGVVSFGEGCARPNKYGVYSNVKEALSWIDATTK
jgi:trypsin